jgi:hypothetical protein
MTPAILDEPIRGAVQQRRKSQSHALHARTWSRVVGTLASGKKLTCAGALAELRRLKLISEGRLRTLGNVHDRDCISCDMSQCLEYKWILIRATLSRNGNALSN